MFLTNGEHLSWTRLCTSSPSRLLPPCSSPVRAHLTPLRPPSRLRCRHRPVRRSTLKHSRLACRSTSARARLIRLTSGLSRLPRQRSRRDPDSHLASITRGLHGRRLMAAPRSVRPRHESLPRHLPQFPGAARRKVKLRQRYFCQRQSCPARHHGRRYRSDRRLHRVNDQEGGSGSLLGFVLLLPLANLFQRRLHRGAQALRLTRRVIHASTHQRSPASTTAAISQRTWRCAGGVERGEWKLSRLFAALDHPVPCRVGDERRDHDRADALRHEPEQRVRAPGRERAARRSGRARRRR